MSAMSFGQTAPPASAKQVQYLLSLVVKAGHADFRDARGPLGLTQRQAAGKFSRSEASALVDRLLAEAEATDNAAESLAGLGELLSAADRLAFERIDAVRGMPAELLAGELQRRGWEVRAPR